MIVETDMLKAHLLLVDGDPVSLGVLVDCFRSEAGITLSTAASPDDASRAPYPCSISTRASSRWKPMSLPRRP